MSYVPGVTDDVVVSGGLDHPEDAGTGWTRRRFLKAGGVTLVAAAHGWSVLDLLRGNSSIFATPATFTRRLVRADDQVLLDLEFVGLDLDEATGQLVASGGGPFLMRMVFPSQHTAENAFGPNGTPNPDNTRGHIDAPATRLVFSVVPPLDFDVDTLLDLAAYSLEIAGSGNPGPDFTAIRVPAGLTITPIGNAGFRALTQPVTRGDVTETWMARLFDPTGTPEIEARNNGSSSDTAVGARRQPDAQNRDDIVALTDPTNPDYAPALAHRLWLSLAGAFADIEGNWDAGAISRWVQRINGGRDVHIEIAERGYLAPFGHPASWVTVQERQLKADSGGGLSYVLVEETYLIVTQPTVEFPDSAQSPFNPDDGRGFPFASVTVDSPPWAPVDKRAIVNCNVDEAWGVTDAPGSNTDLILTYTATDHVGNDPISFDLPARYVDWNFATGSGGSGLVAHYQNGVTEAGRDVPEIGGALVAWAPESTAGSGLTSKQTHRILFSLGSPTGSPTDAQLRAENRPAFFPVVETARIADDTLNTVSGAPIEPFDVTFPPRWLTDGLDPVGNPDLAFLQLDQPQPFSFGEDAKALMVVEMDASVLNQTLGAGPDITVGAPEWDPAEAFGDVARFLGGVLLQELFNVVAEIDFDLGVNVPTVLTEVDGDKITATLLYEPTDVNGIPAFGLSAPGSVSVKVITCAWLTGGKAPTSTIDLTVRGFTLEVPPFVPLVELEFEQLRVVEPSDGPTDFDLDLRTWRFAGILELLQPIVNLAKTTGKNFAIDITPEALDLSVEIPLPTINLGVVSIRNFSVGLGGEFPFGSGGSNGDGLPEVRLNVGKKPSPVTVTVMGFTGKFYMIVEVSPEYGLRRVAVSVEMSMKLFGLDLIIVEASVTLGISAFFELKDGNVTFIGAVWIEGKINVLGIAEVTMRLQATVKYKEIAQNVKITGTIIWSASVGPLSDSGSLPIGGTTVSLGDGAGSGFRGQALRSGEPAPGLLSASGTDGFGQRMTQDDWNEYTGAFA